MVESTVTMMIGKTETSCSTCQSVSEFREDVPCRGTLAGHIYSSRKGVGGRKKSLTPRDGDSAVSAVKKVSLLALLADLGKGWRPKEVPIVRHTILAQDTKSIQRMKWRETQLLDCTHLSITVSPFASRRGPLIANGLVELV